jgi:hypothetical protein
MKDVRRTSGGEQRAAVEIGGQRLECFVVNEGAHVESLVARVSGASGSVECSDTNSLTSSGYENVASA